MKAAAHDRRGSREGIALIIVLGLLAVLVLLGVSFAITMRVERLAAANYLEAARCKHLIDVALARATADIGQDMLRSGSQRVYPAHWEFAGSPNWRNAVEPPLTTNALRYLPRESTVNDFTLASPGEVFEVADAGATLVDYNADWSPGQLNGSWVERLSDGAVATITGNGTNWIRAAIGGGWGVGQRYRTRLPQWQYVRDPSDTTVLLGRFAYLGVNCSGLVDANAVGTNPPLPRIAGNTPAHLDASLMADFSGFPGFVARRENTDRRYESLPELRELAAGVVPNPLNLFVYSRANGDGRWNTTEVKEKIDVNQAAIPSERTNVMGALQASGVPNYQGVYSNLLDYLDADEIPQSVNGFMTEAVPMINELIVSNRIGLVTVQGTNFWTNTVYFTVETWFPFQPGASLGTYQLRLTTPPTIAGGPAPLLPSTATTVLSPPPFGPPVGYSFQSHTWAYEATYTNTGPIGGLFLSFTSGGVDVFNAASQLVDRANAGVVFPPLTIAGGLANGSSDQKGMSCIDPRINWLPAHYAQQTITPLTTNLNAAGVGEGVSEMYVRNGPLQSAAELGFLSVGSPWRTVALYDDVPGGVNLHPVLDYFSAGPVPTNAIRGLVNINSSRSQALAVPFNGIPVQRYPGENGTPVVASDRALGMGDDISQATLAATAGHFYNVSEIGTVVGLFTNRHPTPVSTSALLTPTDATKESLIANAYELLTVRQNLFTVYLAAQAVKDVDGNRGIVDTEVFAEQRAMAIVVRDPYPSASHNYQYPFVRLFRWLVE